MCFKANCNNVDDAYIAKGDGEAHNDATKEKHHADHEHQTIAGSEVHLCRGNNTIHHHVVILWKARQHYYYYKRLYTTQCATKNGVNMILALRVTQQETCLATQCVFAYCEYDIINTPSFPEGGRTPACVGFVFNLSKWDLSG